MTRKNMAPRTAAGPPSRLGHSTSVPDRPIVLRTGSAGTALQRAFQSCLAKSGKENSFTNAMLNADGVEEKTHLLIT
jgi:hypothetical protein